MSLLLFIRHPILRLKRGFTKYPLIIFWRMRFDSLLAKYIGATLFLRNYARLRNSRRKSAILVVERNIFNDDIEALEAYARKNKPEVVFIHIDSYYRRTIENLMLPQEIRAQRNFYAKLPLYRKEVERISKILYGSLRCLEMILRINIAVFLSGNVNYAQEYQWIPVMRRKGGVSIALNKESVIYSPHHERNFIQRHQECNFRYDGDFALLYNERAKEVYIKSNAITPLQALVTGCPRVDRLVLLAKASKTHSNFILLASFGRPNKGGTGLYQEVVETIAGNPYLAEKTLVKCKTPTEAKKLMMQFPMLKAASGPMEQYLKMRPAVVVGFNSSTCLDALIAEIPLLVPVWGDILNLKDGLLLGGHTSSMNFTASSKEDFTTFLKNVLSGGNLFSNKKSWTSDPAIKNFIEYTYSPLDGKNCERFFKFVEKFI